MRYYEATSTIAAGPEAVWAVLSDGADWPAWDSGVVGVEGRMAPGRRSPSVPRWRRGAPSR
jgi:hypothetical protein